MLRCSSLSTILKGLTFIQLGPDISGVAQGTKCILLQAWRVAHPPLRGRTWCCSRPLVHVGFMKSWLAGNFNQKVIHRVMDLVHTCQAGPNKLKIYVTGAVMVLVLQCKTIRISLLGSLDKARVKLVV